jgi:HK97 family phage major capsid protein
MSMEITMEGLQQVVTDSVASALKAVNTVDPAARPAAGGIAAPAFNRGSFAPPRLGVAMKGLFGGFRQSHAFERDLTQAAAELFGYTKSDETDEADPFIAEVGAAKSQRSIIWPKSRAEMVEVLYAMGEKNTAKTVERADAAIKAMSEGTGSAGGFLVPTQYAQDQFAYVLTSTIALRSIPGIQTMPVVSNVVALPRESTAGGASQQTEAGALSAQDATLSQQTITVKKQYGYRQYSNELLADATPAWLEFLANTLVRDVALQQDAQFLFGTAAGAQIQGLIGYSGITAGPSLGANGATPSFDNVFDAVYNLRAVNAEPDFVIAHPRVLNSLQKIKDSTGNFLMSNAQGLGSGGVGFPWAFGTGLAGSPPKAFLLGYLPTWFSSQISIALTVGSSTDCTTVIMGASNQVLILERAGIEVAYSEHVAFANDQSAARAIGRAAVAILQPTAVETLVGVRP